MLLIVGRIYRAARCHPVSTCRASSSHINQTIFSATPQQQQQGQRMVKGSFKPVWAFLALLSLITAAASGELGRCDGEKVCKFSQDGHMCAATFTKNHECCDVDCLKKYDIASFEPGSLTIDAEYTSPHQANIMAKWQYIRGREPSYPIQITIVQGDKRTCLCLPSHVTQFKTDVWDPPRACHNPGTLNISVQLHLLDALDAVKYLRKEITLRKCWSTMGNRSHEVCGPKIPSIPLNVSAVAKEDHNGTSQVAVTWHPPSQEFTPVVSYFLEFIYTDETKEWHPIKAISIAVPRNISTYTFHGLPVNDANHAYVLVRAGVVQGAHPCICCIMTIAGDNHVMYGYAANATVKWSPAGKHSHSDLDTVHLALIAAPTTATVVLVIVIGAMVTCSAYWARRKVHKNRNRAHGQVECSGAPEDRERLIPWFANATNGDRV